VNPHDFPSASGVFEAIESEIVQRHLIEKQVNKKTQWDFASERPGLVIGGIPMMASGTSTTVQERRIIARIEDTCRGYCLPNARADASFAEAPASSINKDLLDLDLSAKDVRTLMPGFRIEQRIAYALHRGRPTATVKEISAVPLIRPRFSTCLPLPSDVSEWRCVASGATWQALLSLNKTYGTPRPPLALVTGRPGSGKDAYAKAVHYGQEGARNPAFPTFSLAEYADWQSLSRELKKAVSKLDAAQMRTSGVFFDEIDKPDERMRSSLLRFLETRKLNDRDCKSLTLVCAAGKVLPELRDSKPPDFWTRMEVHVPIHDPFKAGTQDELTRIIGSFFRHFWWDFWSGWAERVINMSCRPKKGESTAEILDRNSAAHEFAVRLFECCVGKWANGEFRIAEPVTQVSGYFATVLAPHLERRELSLRGLRSATSSVIHGCRPALLAWGLYKSSTADSFVQQAQQSVHEAVGTIIQVIPP
jgi:hypothetical protein